MFKPPEKIVLCFNKLLRNIIKIKKIDKIAIPSQVKITQFKKKKENNYIIL